MSAELATRATYDVSDAMHVVVCGASLCDVKGATALGDAFDAADRATCDATCDATYRTIRSIREGDV